MGMEIRGPNLGTYDAGYLQAVQREMARSVKSNILKEVGDIEDQVALALQGNLEDSVTLSPEAKAYLKKLRRKLLKHKGIDLIGEEDNEEDEEEKPERDFNGLLSDLDSFRRSKSEQEGQKQPQNLIFPTTIQLSGFVPNHNKRVQHQVYSPVRETINRMIYYAPTEASRLKVQDELEPMGAKIISQVRSFGAHIIVLDRRQALTQLKIKGMYVVAPSEKTFDGRYWSEVRGLYDSSRRLLVIGEEQLGQPNHSVARHEFAHAYDNAFSETHGRRLPLSVQLWNKFRHSRTGLVSNYASTNPAEYFAETVEAYFQPALKPIVEQRDPEMYAYLQELFSA
ncbi:MAG: zinc-dependent peptidase [Candidatus Bruticola sp.]